MALSEALLPEFDHEMANTRKTLERVPDDKFDWKPSDAELFKGWTLLHGGKQILTLPKIAVLRSFVMNHNVRHRAQLGVYLRLNDIPVPSIYGPSADEGAF